MSDAVVSAEVSTQIFDQPGKLSLTLVDDSSLLFYEGSNVVLWINSLKVFDGYVFERNRTQADTMTVVVYDRIRYLQGKDTKVFKQKSVQEIFETICKEQRLPYKTVSPIAWKTASIIHDNKSMYSMIKRALDETFIKTQNYLILRDNRGTLELINIKSLQTNVLVGDEHLMEGFNFTASIDKETYNYIKVIKEDKKKKTRVIHVAHDSSTEYKWGRLQLVEKMDEDANDAQMTAKAMQLLKLYNRKTKTLKLACIGDLNVREGSGIAIGIDKLKAENVPYQKFAFVTAVTHKFSNGEHTMDLEMEVV